MNTKDYLSKFVEFDKKYTFTPSADDNVLTIQALREVYDVIREYCNDIGEKGLRIDLPNTVNLHNHNPDDGWDLWRDDSGRTWVKRYRNYVRDISGIVLPTSLLGKVGETCARVRGAARGKWVFDFHVGIDWSPGEFAESDDSCLWSDYDLGRRLARERGLCAIRFYENNEGIGRALLWLASDGALHVFNNYHKDGITRESVARMLAEFLGKDKTINCNLQSHDLFINGDRSTALTNDSAYKYNTLVLDQVVDGKVHCAECFRNVDVETTTKTHYGRNVCPDCLNEYLQCPDCGEWFFVHHIGEDGLCWRCSREDIPF